MRMIFFSLFSKGFLFVYAPMLQLSIDNFLLSAEKRHDPTHLFRAFTWPVEETLSMILCVHDGLRKKVYTCVRHTTLAHWILMVWSTYWNLILEMKRKKKKLIWNTYIVSYRKKEGKKHREKEKFLCWWKRTEIHNLSNHIQTHTDTGRALMVDFNCIYYKSKEKLLYRTNTKM